MKIKSLLLILLYLFYGISVSIIHPVTPSFCNELQIGDLYYGLLFSMMSLGMFIGSIFFGILSKRYKRSYLLFIGILGYTLSQYLFGFVNSIPWLILLWRFLGGLCVAAPLSFYSTYTNDLVLKDNEKTKLLSVLVPSEIVGEAFGYKIGGLLFTYAKFTYDSLFIFQIIFLFLIAILSLIFLRYIEKNKAEDTRNVPLVKKLKENICKKASTLHFFAFVMIICVGTQACIMTTKFSEKYIIDCSFNSDQLGTLMMICALSGTIVSFLISLLLKKKANDMFLFYSLLLFLAGLFILITYIIPENNLMIALYTSYLFFYICKCLLATEDTRIVLNLSDETNKGLHMGIRQGGIALGNFIGPILAGIIYPTNHLLTFYISSGILITLSIFTMVFHFLQKQNH